MCPTILTRRKFIGGAAVAIGAVTIGGSIGHGEEPAPPVETGLSSEACSSESRAFNRAP